MKSLNFVRDLSITTGHFFCPILSRARAGRYHSYKGEEGALIMNIAAFNFTNLTPGFRMMLHRNSRHARQGNGRVLKATTATPKAGKSGTCRARYSERRAQPGA
jgi:hypothetical protein